jgi:hypothetical protein
VFWDKNLAVNGSDVCFPSGKLRAFTVNAACHINKDLCSSALLLFCSAAHLIFCSYTLLLICSYARLLFCSSAHLLICSSAHLLFCSFALLLIYSSVNLLFCSSALLLMQSGWLILSVLDATQLNFVAPHSCVSVCVHCCAAWQLTAAHAW